MLYGFVPILPHAFPQGLSADSDDQIIQLTHEKIVLNTIAEDLESPINNVTKQIYSYITNSFEKHKEGIIYIPINELKAHLEKLVYTTLELFV